MNVADMWACLQGHHTDNHWRHVAGWRKIAELAGQHLGRLRTYRERLAQVWPPETNAASHAYLVKLDELISQVQRTHDAATANQTALSAATQALTSSRSKLQKIHEEYADKLQQKRSWEQTAADPKAAAASRAIHPPVSESDLERLNAQARNIMYGLSTELQQAQTQLRHPPPTPRASVQTSDPDVYATGIQPPAIPPIVPMSPPKAASPAISQFRSPPLKARATHTTGPILGSAVLASTSSNYSPPTNLTAEPPPNLTAGTDPRPTPFWGVNGHPLENGRPTQITSDRQPPRTGGSNSTRGTPTGGLIGGSPAAGIGHPTSPNAPARPTPPFGGLIGGGAAGTAPTGGAGSRPGGGRSLGGVPLPPPIGSPPGTLQVTGMSERQGRSARPTPGDTGARSWDPDNPWATASGVEPIVTPPKDDGPIDPGPAIGLNR
ncbi:hypothetical protein SAMN05216284_11142 [Micromonospora sediminimaris]|nr:hypothetical protein SAMN05216284_11142 [Micromonospora sediminimaris]